MGSVGSNRSHSTCLHFGEFLQKYIFRMFAIYAGICVLWIILNARVISVIVTMPRSQCRPSTWLVAHMAVIAILANYTGIVFMIDRFDLLSIQRYLGVCQSFRFISGEFPIPNNYLRQTGKFFRKIIIELF